MGSCQTVFGCGVQVIGDDPKYYVFNCFEVASKSKPYEKVAVGQNLKYVIEAIRAAGVSPWYSNAHDGAVLVMDGEVEVHVIQPEKQATDGIVWDVDDGKTGQPRARVSKKASDIAAIRHQGYSPKRSMPIVWENKNVASRHVRQGRAKVYPVEF